MNRVRRAPDYHGCKGEKNYDSSERHIIILPFKENQVPSRFKDEWTKSGLSGHSSTPLTRFYSCIDRITNEEVIIGFEGNTPIFHGIIPGDLILTKGYISLYGTEKTWLFLEKFDANQKKKYINENPEFFI